MRNATCGVRRFSTCRAALYGPPKRRLCIAGAPYERIVTMAVLERVATLVRANLNDLIDRAEDPEKMIKQVILDMENQLVQVKTQVAIAMADQHLLQKKQSEHEDKAAEWMRKAELAVDKGQDDLARAALERYQSLTKLAESFTRQLADQKGQVDTLRRALDQLDQKLGEARGKSDVMLAQHRRARALEKANDAQLAIGANGPVADFERLKTLSDLDREEVALLAIC